jgi:hypothetical protein
MINITLNDKIQEEIKNHLVITEELLSEVATKVSGSRKEANILLLPDLGLPKGARRIHGGFFVGAFYFWDTSKAFVPVDSTINSCGVSLFRLKHPVKSQKDFIKQISSAKENVYKTSYLWNFNNSNHFISYGEIIKSEFLKDGYYAILHSSACEFKFQYNGLYPVEENWYYDSIKSIHSKTANRDFRYIDGRKAEDFIKTAQMLGTYNQIRHQRFAEMVFSKNIVEEEVIYSQHYGMPTSNSIAIGCQWLYEEGIYLLLTTKDSPVYIILAKKGFNNTVTVDNTDLILVPHGLGNISLIGDKINYDSNNIKVGNKSIKIDEHFEFGKDIDVREFMDSKCNNKEAVTLDKILSKCPGEVLGMVNQKYNYNQNSGY